MKHNALYRSFLSAHLVEWDRRYQTTTEEERWELVREADSAATHAARLAAYIGRRQTGGDHHAAVDRQNRVAAKVRAALGYTIKDDPFDF